VKLFGMIFAGLFAALFMFVVAILATQDPVLAHNNQVWDECMKREERLMQIRGTQGTGLGALNARLACTEDLKQKGIQRDEDNDRTTGCDAMHRDERGVWVWTLTPEKRAACLAGE
jgi:hypothetical protein